MKELELSQPAQKLLILPGNQLVFINGTNKVYSMDLNDLSSGPEILYESNDEQEFQSLCFNETYNWLALASGGNIQILNLDNAATRNFIASNLPVSHNAVISNMKFSPDNKWIVSASWDGTIMLWSLHPEIRETFDKYVPVVISNVNQRILSLDFDLESKYLISGNNHYLSIYPIDINDVANRLYSTVNGRELSDNQFLYYVKGDLEKPEWK